VAKATVYSLTNKEQSLVAETGPEHLRALDEDALVEVLTRVRRARDKYVKLYRREAGEQVRIKRARGTAAAQPLRNAAKAEILSGAPRRARTRTDAVSVGPDVLRRVVARHSDDDRGDVGQDEGLGLATKTRTKTKTPSPYKVLMLNDDYTPMEFVVLVLQRFFKMGIEDATRVMLHVHQRGVGVCGIFPYEVAETKVSQVIDFARENQHPLQCTLEKA
jgi:ATP-dependent Clp protease adaptor protein ClpS